MRKVLRRCLTPLLLLALPAAALAETSVDSTTLVRISQNKQAGFATKTLAPATQFLGIDVGKLGDGNLSLHLYGWGRADLADRSYNNNYIDGNLTYAYAQYRLNQANGQLRVGRFFFTEGILNEQIDGIDFHTDLPLGFGLSAFGGATVHTTHLGKENTDGKGDGILGGRLNYRYKGMLELGVSGVYESDAPALTNPANQLFLTNSGRYGNHRLLGGDVWVAPHRMLEVAGHTSYNPETKTVAEHSYLLNVKPLSGLVLTGEFDEHRERAYFYSSILFSSMVQKLNERSRSTGGRVSYELTKGIEVSADFKHYTRDRGAAERFGGDVKATLKDKTIRAGAGYHYLRASGAFAAAPGTTASGSFHELRAYAMHDAKQYFCALDAIGYFFKENINNRPSALEFIGSLGYRITPGLAVSGDISYGKNPQFLDDLKGLVRLTYNMNYAGKGGSK